MSRLPRTVFRALDGIVLLDKPAGLSSNQALQRVRHLFRAEKGGHTGSLDPLATGMLPLCFGEATKIAGHLLGNAKAYDTIARLGVVTDTDDADGKPLRERAIPALQFAQVERFLIPFHGKISQRPPIYSALKQGGEPLYAKARRGEVIEVPLREVRVDRIQLLALAGDNLRMRITCGSGTYIRSIVRDLGEALGCGAHVTELRRLWVDPFMGQTMHSLADLVDRLAGQGEGALEAAILPLEAGLVGWPRVSLDTAQATALGHGQPVPVPAETKAGAVLAVDEAARALAIAHVGEDGLLRVQRLFRWAVRG